MKKLYLIATICLVAVTSTFTADAAVVKKSRSGICHDQNSVSYTKTKHFEEFASLEQCIESGGRLPKGYATQTQAASTTQTGTHNSAQNGGYHEYNRDDWKHWTDPDGNCRNTRHDHLFDTSKREVTFSYKTCTVKTGLWYDPYSDKNYTKASDLDLDHIVPLAWADRHGGASFSPALKEQFANDPDNLILVRDVLNQEKSAQGPNEWLPPNQGYRCNYVIHFDKVVKKYQLQYNPVEQRIITRMLDRCAFQ
ncbi:HNH endonuclease family protein [Shewanella marisflavi]|uniref:HNH endonuclease family protein n=1 Tax=Shewanella marisflavi TaxID=260364 RepID=UPI003AAEE6F5